MTYLLLWLAAGILSLIYMIISVHLGTEKVDDPHRIYLVTFLAGPAGFMILLATILMALASFVVLMVWKE